MLSSFLIQPFQSQSVINTQFLLTQHIQIKTFGNEKMIVDLTKEILEFKRKILSNLLSEKNGLKLGEFNNTTGTERFKSRKGKIYYGEATEHIL